MSSELNRNILIKFLMFFVGISGCFSVLFGAWLAHGGKLLAPAVLSSLETAQLYQLIHTLALLATLVWAINKPTSKIVLAACISFFIGVLCFSGTIYLKVFFNAVTVGKLTPIGGMSLALAWLLLSFEGIKKL